MRPRVYIVQPAPEGAVRELAAFADVDMFPHVERRPTRHELKEGVAGADVVFALGENPIDGEIMDAGPRLRLIAVMEIFPVHVDQKAATERGIPVTGLPHMREITETTAEYTFTLMSAVAWRVTEAERMLREGRWQQYQSTALPTRLLAGKRLGIVGLGAVGEGLARRARCHGLMVTYHDRRRLHDREASLQVRWQDLESLFAESDYVALCTTLTEETEGLVGRDLLWRMKPDAILVNTSRGRVLDEDALVEALEQGRLAGAGLDVYRREIPEPDPGPDPRLLALPNLVLTPHIGTSARETREAMAREAVGNIRRLASGGRPAYVLNPEVYGEAPLRHERIG